MLSLAAIDREIVLCEEEIDHFLGMRMSVVNRRDAGDEDSYCFEIEGTGILITVADDTAYAVIGAKRYSHLVSEHSTPGKGIIQWSYMYDSASFDNDCIANGIDRDQENRGYFVRASDFTYLDDGPTEGFSFDLTVRACVFGGDGSLSIGCHLEEVTYRVVFIADA
jgi:hypothetical protein